METYILIKQIFRIIRNLATLFILYLMRIFDIEYEKLDMNKTAYRKRLLEKIRKGKL